MSKIVLGVAVIGLLTVGLAFSLLIAWQQARQWIYPVRNLPTLTPTEVGLSNWEDVAFETPDGLHLVGWFIYPEPTLENGANTEKEGATLIFLHGIGANRAAMLTEASLLVKRGYNALMIDLRGHGGSGGNLTTLGYNEIYDVQGAVEYLHTRADVDPQRIALYGRSLGGAIALRAAARIPEIRAIVAESSFKSVEDNVTPIVRALTGRRPIPSPAAVLWFVEQETGVAVGEVRPIDDLAQIAPRPVLLIHGEQDFVVPVQNSQEMYQAAQEPKELFLIPNGQHTKLVALDAANYEARVTGFFEKHLGDQPSGR